MTHNPLPITHHGFFVTGTDTGVGKTLIACALLHAFAARDRLHADNGAAARGECVQQRAGNERLADAGVRAGHEKTVTTDD